MRTREQDEEVEARLRELPDNIADCVARHARRVPKASAIVEHNTGVVVSWKELDRAVDAFAAKLLAKGFKKGEVIATSLPLLKEHVYLILACYRLGVIVAPLDLRLRAGELRACFEKLRPQGYFFAGAKALLPILKEVVGAFPGVRHFVQFQKEKEGLLPEAVHAKDFFGDVGRHYLLSLLTRSVRRARRRVGRRDPCLVIFTTGSTGSPKAALLCHQGILCQNVSLAVGFGLTGKDRLLVNLPPSHVGCTTELLGTAIYQGITSVLLHIFDAEKSLAAIEEHRVTVVGQIPALFNLEWNHRLFAKSDLSSLRLAIYGGQGVPLAFLERLRAMAAGIGTGLGLTETSGFCTYTPVGAGVEELSLAIGLDSPSCRISIRAPMRADGMAGQELLEGEVGLVCFSGPQLFLGYLGDPEASARAVSRDGILYTGDVGSYDGRGLSLVGRSGLAIKPKGFLVYPGDVENHVLSRLGGAASAAGCVGAEHSVWVEAVMLFVECAPGRALTREEVLEASAGMASYARPSHVEILAAGEFPLNRVAKTDYLDLRERAKAVVARLRSEGAWDVRA